MKQKKKKIKRDQVIEEIKLEPGIDLDQNIISSRQSYRSQNKFDFT